MADVQPLSDDERAELIAYLDGEADARTARDIEAKLNRDPRMRAEADALQQAWQLLDFLPKPGPSPQFAQRTMTAASVIRATGLGRASPWRPWLLGAGWAMALIVTAIAGYAAAPLVYRPALPELPTPADGEQLLQRELRIIENLRLYEAGRDIHFLNELDRPELFGDEQAGH